MTCGCPAWQSYRDTEEVCDLPVSDGSIFFLVGVDEELSVTTYNIYTDTYQVFGGTPLVEGDTDMPDPCVFDTSLPNPEIGTWRYEFTGTFVDTTTLSDTDEYPDLDSIGDCVITTLVDEGGGVFHWECEVLNPLVSYTVVNVQVWCDGTPPGWAVYDVLFNRQLWEGVLDIYYTVSGIEYGPITVNATVTRVKGLECY